MMKICGDIMECKQTSCLFSRLIRLADGSSSPCCHFMIDTALEVSPYRDLEKGTCGAYTYVNKRTKQKYLKIRWFTGGNGDKNARKIFKEIQRKNSSRRIVSDVYGTKYVDERNLGGVRRFSGKCPRLVEKVRHT